MENLELNAASRDTAVKAKNIRKEGRIPAVVYGKGEENLFVDFDYQEFRKAYLKAGHNTLVNLNVDGKKPVEVLVYLVDYHPVTGDIIHADLRLITRGVEITTEVNITFEGTSEAVKTLGGVLVTNKSFLEIKCLPRNLIHEVTADLTKLTDFHEKITVADISVPETVEVLNSPDELIAMVNAPRAVVEEDTAEDAGATEEGTAEGSEDAAEGGEENKEEGNA